MDEPKNIYYWPARGATRSSRDLERILELLASGYKVVVMPLKKKRRVENERAGKQVGDAEGS